MKISQREARKLRKRVAVLEDTLERQRRVWSQEYIGGVQITSITMTDGVDPAVVAVRTARALGHAVVVVGDQGGTLRLIALPHPKVNV